MAIFNKIIALITILLCTYAKDSFAESRIETKPHYTIATGSVGATFYPIGKSICDLVNGGNLSFTCEAVSTGGSIYNLNSLKEGNHDFGISQSNIQFDSYMGSGSFEDSGENSNLVSVINLHSEIMLIAIRRDLKANSFTDLKYKKVSIGNIGSGTNKILNEMFKNIITEEDFFSDKLYLKSSEITDALCNSEIDAAIYSTGHPNEIYKVMTDKCGVKLIGFNSELKGHILFEAPPARITGMILFFLLTVGKSRVFIIFTKVVHFSIFC
jgi:hypothetical protein